MSAAALQSRFCHRLVKRAGYPLVWWGCALSVVFFPSGYGRAADKIRPDRTTISASETIRIEVSGGKLVRGGADAGTAFVADPTIADIQMPKPSSFFVYGKKPGRTTLFVLDKDGAPLMAYAIDVRFPEDELDSQIASASGGTAHLVYTANGALLRGMVPDAATADQLRQTAEKTLGPGVPLVNQLKVAGHAQVNLRVRVAEVSRAVSRALGFNGMLSAGGFSFGVQPGQIGIGGSVNGLGGVFSAATSGSAGGSAVLDAMAREGLVSMLAEPNLTAESGNTATFLAGGEIPVPVSQGLGAVSVQYQQYGVSVTFTPTVLTSGHISMKVRPEVSAIDRSNSVDVGNSSQLPALTTRRAETTVELASGQSFAIAGLIQNDDNNNVRKLMGVGDIPVLGALFRSTRFQRNQSELVIVVTPYVVRPTGPGAPPDIPTDYVNVPSDADTLVAGKASTASKKVFHAQRPRVRRAPNNVRFVFE